MQVEDKSVLPLVEVLISYVGTIEYKCVHYMNCVDSTLSFALRTKWRVWHSWIHSTASKTQGKSHFAIEGNYGEIGWQQAKSLQLKMLKTENLTVPDDHDQHVSVRWNGFRIRSVWALSPRLSALGQPPHLEVCLSAAPVWNSPFSSSARAFSRPRCKSETSAKAIGK